MPIYKNKLVNKTLGFLMIKCTKCGYEMSNTQALTEGVMGFFKSLVATVSLSTVANQISAGIANKGKVKCPSCGVKAKWEDA